MNKIRSYQIIKNKRTAAGLSLRSLGTVLLFLLFLPYIITFLFGNLWNEEIKVNTSGAISESLSAGNYYIRNKTSLGYEEIPVEVYVADKLSRVMGDDFLEEALKAQAVLIRTDLAALMNSNDYIEDEAFGSKEVTEKVQMAVNQTKGMYISYKGEPILASYFAVSNGATRNASELFEKEYPYLKSVPCSRDFLSEEFSSSIEYDLKEFDRIWSKIPDSEAAKKIFEDSHKEPEEKTSGKDKKETVSGNKSDQKIEIIRDSVGYVNAVYYKEKYITGEQYRAFYHTASSCFHLEIKDNEVFIQIKGAGHGLGLSQYYANELAVEDKSFHEILNYFFKDIIITKFE